MANPKSGKLLTDFMPKGSVEAASIVILAIVLSYIVYAVLPF